MDVGRGITDVGRGVASNGRSPGPGITCGPHAGPAGLGVVAHVEDRGIRRPPRWPIKFAKIGPHVGGGSCRDALGTANRGSDLDPCARRASGLASALGLELPPCLGDRDL